MPSGIIMFKVRDLNGNTNQTVTVNYNNGSETIPITEGNKWYVHNIPSGKILNQFVGIYDITDTIISAKLVNKITSGLLPYSYGNATLIGCDISDLTSISDIFYWCNGLISLTVDGLDTSNITNMHQAFLKCINLKNLDLSTWVTSNVTRMTSMFKGCRSLQVLNISGWDMTKATNMTNMFSECSSLNTIYMRNCSQATIDKIKAQLETDGILNNVTIITE
jgi:surface protein